MLNLTHTNYSHSSQSCFELNANTTGLPAAHHRYDNYVKTQQGGRGPDAKANCQRWRAYQGLVADPQQAGKLSANPSRKRQM